MRILVTFAVKAEFSPWSSRHPFVPYEFENWEKRRAFDLFKTNYGPHELAVLLTGMGRENATEAMRSIPVGQCDLCISSGLAGALDASLKPGDVVVARTSETLDHSLMVASDPFLVDSAVTCGARPVDTLLTSNKILATADEKQEVSALGAIIDMETSHILATAVQHRVPAVAVRAVSDSAEEDLPVDFSRVLDSRGRLRFTGIVTDLVLHPYRIAPLLKFAGQSRAASVKLADFLDRYISELSRNPNQIAAWKEEEVSAT